MHLKAVPSTPLLSKTQHGAHELSEQPDAQRVAVRRLRRPVLLCQSALKRLRLIYSPQLQSTHCYEPARWRGRWKDVKGKMHRVWACDGHAGDLELVRRIGSKVTS